jgi:hypothetical protein
VWYTGNTDGEQPTDKQPKGQIEMERTKKTARAMARLAMAEHEWRWDADELENPDEDGNDDWSRMAGRFLDGTATDEDWTTMLELCK